MNLDDFDFTILYTIWAKNRDCVSPKKIQTEVLLNTRQHRVEYFTIFIRNGFSNLHFRIIYGQLIEKHRNDFRNVWFLEIFSIRISQFRTSRYQDINFKDEYWKHLSEEMQNRLNHFADVIPTKVIPMGKNFRNVLCKILGVSHRTVQPSKLPLLADMCRHELHDHVTVGGLRRGGTKQAKWYLFKHLEQPIVMPLSPHVLHFPLFDISIFSLRERRHKSVINVLIN